MIEVRTAYTLEIDEAEAAVSDILEQLDLEALLKHSVGILTCHADFIPSGAVKAICDRLPFDVVGTTTLAASTEKATDVEILTLMILTSDEVEFTTQLTSSLQNDQSTPIRQAYQNALQALPEAPTLAMVYAPLLQNVGGEKLVRILDEVLNGVPLFGTLTCDHNFNFSDSRVIYNGEATSDQMALIVMSGPVRCSFMTISIPERNAQKQNAIITESEGNVVMKINDIPLLDYLESIGLTRDGGLKGSKYIPVILDYNDGTPPIARCFYMISPEGNAVCGGDMPVGATFALSNMEAKDIITSTDQLLQKMLDSDINKVSGILMIPCIVRSLTLGLDQLEEARHVAEKIGGGVPYQLCYSGGEICPVYQTDGETANRFHNFSFAVCVFSK